MDKFEEKVLNTLKNLEASGTIEGKPEKVFMYAADIYFEDGSKAVFPFTSENKEDYKSAYTMVLSLIAEFDLFADRGKYTIGNIKEIEDSVKFFDERFDTFMLNQNDAIDNAILALVQTLARNKNAEWDAEWGGAIINAIIPILADHDIKCCYPYHGITDILSDDEQINYGSESVPCYRDGIRCEYSGDVCMFCHEHCIVKAFDDTRYSESEEN